MPTFALDATYGVGGQLTGVGVYSREMLTGLAGAHPEAGFRWCYRTHKLARGWRAAKPRNAGAWPLFEHWAPPCDVFHGLNQRLPMRRMKRAVATFHDLFVMSSDQYSSAEFRARFTAQARAAAERSDLIIAVSAFTASQVESLLGVERSRIRVVHHGVHLPALKPAMREPVILSVGALQHRKNTLRLVRAFEALDAPEWRLVLVGSVGYGGEEALQAIERSPKRKAIEVRGFVDDAERERLYRSASIFAFPSLDEGFGMPVLEAMSYGTPVVTSAASSLPEVAGNAAILVDPQDVSAIGRGLKALVDDTGRRRQLEEAGRARAAEFSWAAAVEKTWAVYQELVA